LAALSTERVPSTAGVMKSFMGSTTVRASVCSGESVSPPDEPCQSALSSRAKLQQSRTRRSSVRDGVTSLQGLGQSLARYDVLDLWAGGTSGCASREM
jgi:hypothetical protein